MMASTPFVEVDVETDVLSNGYGPFRLNWQVVKTVTEQSGKVTTTTRTVIKSGHVSLVDD